MRELLILLLGIALAAGTQTSTTSCRIIPGDPGWPAVQDWRALNQSVNGLLIATVPIASVCHKGGVFDGRFDNTTCELLKSFWDFPIAHFPYPGEVSFPWTQNQSCDPFTPTSQPCELGNYVSYSINVTGPADVMAGIKFAQTKNVRLVIKNTGHE